MKEVDDDRFGTVYVPSSFSDLMSLVTKPDPAGFSVYMWRGQASDKWLLHSGAYRRVSNGGFIKEQSLRYYEKELLERATHRGFRNYEGRELSDFELLARLQHHGAATRLLDTTRNVLVAIFFSCNQLPDQDGLLFGIHSDCLGGGEDRPLSGSYLDNMKSIEKYEHPQTWQPSEVSKRIAVQHSQFIYSKVVNSPHGSIALDAKKDKLLTVRIAAEKKLGYLEIISRSFDINRRGLFPDLEGFAALHSADQPLYGSERW